MKTRAEIKKEIEILDRIYYREDYYGHTATANMAEMKRDDLQDIYDNMKDNQLADCDHLFWD